MKYLLTLATISIYATTVFSQQTKFSEPIDLPLGGWNKVIQTRDSNTTLIHLEDKKSITVKVFNKEKKEIASQSYLSKKIDHSLLSTAEIHGVYEINDQVVVFLQQEVFGKETLFRLCFNSKTGRLTEEGVVLKSKSLRKEMKFNLAFNKASGGYAVFVMKDLLADYTQKLYLHLFDKNHNEVKKVKIPLETNGTDYVKHISTTVHRNGGVVVSLLFRNVIKHSTVMDNKMVISYLAPNDTSFSTTVTPLAKNAAPYYGLSSYDKFGKKVNYLYVDAVEGIINNGLEKLSRTIYTPTFLQYSVYNLHDMQYSRISNRKVDEFIMQQTDSDYYLLDKAPLAPIFFHTNKYGMTTIISEIIHEGVPLKGVNRLFTCLDDIVITQFDGDRQEIWNTVIPKRQLIYGSLNGWRLVHRNTKRNIFRANSEIDWEYQFPSLNAYYTPKRNTYVIYNDMKANAGQTISLDIDTVFDFNKSDAMYYLVSRDRTISSGFLYGEPIEDENFASMIESADYKPGTQTYCTVVLHREGDKKELMLGWTKLKDE